MELGHSLVREAAINCSRGGVPRIWGGGLHFSPNFGGGVDEVGYFWGEVKIFSLCLGGGVNICFLKNIIKGGALL